MLSHTNNRLMRQRAWAKTARVISHNPRLQVVFAGSLEQTAGTNMESYVRLPKIPDMLPPEYVTMVDALFDHEVLGHILHSDKNLLKDPEVQAMLRKNKMLKPLWNSIEDVMVETHIYKKYPGSEDRMNHMNNFYRDMIVKSWGQGAVEGGIAVWLFYKAMFNVDVAELSKDDGFVQSVGTVLEPFLDRVRNVASSREAWALTLEIFEAMKQQLGGEGDSEQQQEEQKGKKQKGQGGGYGQVQMSGGSESEPSEGNEDGDGDSQGNSTKSKGKGDKGGKGQKGQQPMGGNSGSQNEGFEEGDGEGGGSDSTEEGEEGDNKKSKGKSKGKNKGEDEQDENEDGEGDGEGGDPSDEQNGDNEAEGKGKGERKDGEGEQEEDGEAEGQGGTEAEEENNADPQDENNAEFSGVVDALLQQALSHLIKDMEDCNVGYIMPAPTAVENDEVKVIEASDCDRYDYARYNKLNAFRDELKRRIHRYLVAESYRKVNPNKRKGSLDTRKVYRVFTGSDRIFKTKKLQESMETACTILVDCSGSMNDTFVQDMSYIMSGALEYLQVNYELAFFREKSMGEVNRNRREYQNHLGKDERDQYSRNESFMYGVIKPRHRRCVGIIPYVNQLRTHNCTPLPECMDVARKELSTVHADRKILFVITDGEPYYSNTNTYKFNRAWKDYTKEVVAQCKRDGVETFGIFLDTGQGTELFPFHSVVHSRGGGGRRGNVDSEGYMVTEIVNQLAKLLLNYKQKVASA